jgi:putative ATPase
MPEGAIPMAECAVYLALAPKSNSAYAALGRALEDARSTAAEPVPLHLRNAATGLMAAFGYGASYRYDHDEPGHVARGQAHLPERLAGREYYQPGATGWEATASQRWRNLLAGLPQPDAPLPEGAESTPDDRED